MAVEVILHLHNEDPVLAEVDNLPDPTHQFVHIMNPRRRDGQRLHYITEGAESFLFPWTRITFVEIMASEEDKEVIEFFRE